MSVKIDEKLTDHLAYLSRLQFSDTEKKEIMKDLSRMVEFVDKLKELDTEGVEPLVYITDETNVLREDRTKPCLSQEEVLLNAPKKDSDYFRVPKVVEKKS